MYDIQSLTQILGLTENQLRDILDQLGMIMGEHIKRGSRQKILVTDEGLAILRRAKELESNGLSPKDVQAVIRKELWKPHGNSITTLGEGLQRLLAEKDQRLEDLKQQLQNMQLTIDRLEHQLDQKDKQIEYLQDLLNRQLPGKVHESKIREDPMEYLKLTVEKQRQEIEELRLKLEEAIRPWWRRLFRKVK